MNMETLCTPSRSSLMTGRWAIRSGCHSVPFGGVADSLTNWEVPIGEALSDAGYSTGYYGKWHLGSQDGRLPSDAKASRCFFAERLQAVKLRSWKLHFMRQDTMFDPPVKNPVPTIFNLYTDPREEKPTADTWVVGPVLKIVGDYESSVKQHPLIPMGTPDPYLPRQ